MPLTKNPAAYTDVELILDQIMAKGQGTLTFPDYKAAMRWRMRAYYLRKLLCENALALQGRYSSKYTHLNIAANGPQLHITFIPVQSAEILLDGKPIAEPVKTNLGLTLSQEDDDIINQLKQKGWEDES